MINYKEILRVLQEDYGRRKIERSLHTSRELLDAGKMSNITWQLIEFVINEQIEFILFLKRYSTVCIYLEPDYHTPMLSLQSAESD